MKKNFLNKREQSQARLSYAECEKSRLKARLFSLLVLLMTAVSGAWALTTHVVTQTTVDQIFNGDGYTLGDAVKAGDVLDFQGTIDIEHSLIVNKQVTIKSTTTDAVVKLNTPTNVMSSAYTATVMYPQSFVINKAGSGTTVQDIRIENTETWIYNTSNVTFTGVTFHVEARVGSGVGHLAVRYSDHVTFDGCTIYTKDNGSTSSFVLTGSSNCTVENCTILSEGSVGNPLVLGNTQNTNNDKPNGFSLVNDHNTVKNCTINAPISPLCQVNLCGKYGLLEGNTITCNVSSSFGAVAPTSFDERITYRNNTIGGYLSPLAYSTVEGNTVAGTLSVPQGSVLTGNTVGGNVTIGGENVTFTDNNVFGKLTSSQKGATIQGNTVISTEEYAVYLNSTADDANNAVKNNVLLGAFREGDDAVYCKKPEANTIIDNTAKAYDYELTVAKSEHGSGTIKFFIGDYELKGAYEKYEGKTVTMTVTPDEGYVVGSVSANAYTTWAGSRRNAPAAIPMLGNVTLTPVEGKANTWTFTMPAASVELKVGYLATSNLFLSKEALADKASIAVTAGETTVEFDDDGKSTTTVIEGNTVTTKYNGTKKILGMKVAKKAAAAKTITIGDMKLTYADGDTWEAIVSKNSDKIKTIAGGYIVQVAQPAPNQYRYLKVVLSTNKVNPSDIIDPSKNYEWDTLEVYS